MKPFKESDPISEIELLRESIDTDKQNLLRLPNCTCRVCLKTRERVAVDEARLAELEARERLGL